MSKIDLNGNVGGPQVPFWMKEPPAHLAKNLPGARPGLADAKPLEAKPQPVAAQASSNGFVAFFKNLWNKIFGRAAQPANPPAPRVAAAGQQATFNEQTLDSLVNPSCYNEAPESIKAAIENYKADLAGRYGAESIKNEHFRSVFGAGNAIKAILKPVIDAANAEHRDATPQEVVDALADAGRKGAARLAIKENLDSVAKANNYDESHVIPSSFIKSHPQIAAEIEAAETPEAAAQVFAKYADDFKAAVKTGNEIEQIRQTLADETIAKIAQRTGVDIAVVQKHFYKLSLENKAEFLSRDIMAGAKEEYKAPGFDVKTEFGKLTDKIAGMYERPIAQLRAADIPDKLKQKWILQLVSSHNPKGFDIDKLLAIADKINVAGMKNATSPLASGSKMSNFILSLSQQVNKDLTALYGPAEWKDLGADGRDAVTAFVLDAAIYKSKELYGNLTDPGIRSKMSKAYNAVFNVSMADNIKLPKELAKDLAIAKQYCDYLFNAFERNCVHNYELGKTLSCINGYSRLPEEYAGIPNEVHNELKLRFGEDAVKENMQELFPSATLANTHAFCDAVKAANVEQRKITAEEFKAALKENAALAAIGNAINKKMADIAAQHNLPGPSTSTVNKFLDRFKDTHTKALLDAATPEEFRAIVDSLDEEAGNFLAINKLLLDFAKETKDEVAQKIGDALGLDADTVKRDFKYATRLNGKAAELVADINAGTYEGSLDDKFDYKKPFEALVDKTANGYINAFKTIDALDDIPVEVKNRFKKQIATADKPGIYNFTAIKAIAAKIDLARLGELLANGSDEEVLKEISRLGATLFDSVIPAYRAVGAEPPEGSDETNSILHLVVDLAAHSKPGLVENFNRRGETLNENLYPVLGMKDPGGVNTFSVMMGAYNSDAKSVNNALKAKLSKPETMPFLYQTEFAKMAFALDEEFQTGIETPADYLENFYLPDGQSVKQGLADELDKATKAGKEISAAEFAAIGQKIVKAAILTGIVQNDKTALMAEAGVESEKSWNEALDCILKRNAARIDQIGDKAGMDELLETIRRECVSAMKSIDAIRTASLLARPRILNTFCGRTGIAKEDARMRLDTSEVAFETPGTVLNAQHMALVQKLANPDANLDDDALKPETISANANAAIDAVANGKADCLIAIRNAGLSEAETKDWIERITGGTGFNDPAIVDAARRIAQNAGLVSLMQALAQTMTEANLEHADPEAIKAAFANIGTVIAQLAASDHAFAGQAIANDVLKNIAGLAATFAAGSVPGFIEGLERLEDRNALRPITRSIPNGSFAGRAFFAVANRKAKSNMADALIQRYAANFTPERKALIREFLIKSNLSEDNRATLEKYLARFMEAAMNWQSFTFDDHMVDDVKEVLAGRVKGRVTDIVSGAADNTETGHFDDLGISRQLEKDASRSYYTINGATFYPGGPVDPVVNKMIESLPTVGARKVATAIMNQFAFNDILFVSNGKELVAETPGVPATNAMVDAPGATVMLQRKQDDVFTMPAVGMGAGSYYKITVAPDGKTATIDMEFDFKLTVGIIDDEYEPNDIFGYCTLKQQIVLDISTPEPKVTDYKIAQEIKP